MGPNAVTQQIGFGKKQVIKSPSGCHLSPFPPLPHPCDARLASGGPSKRVPSHNTILLKRSLGSLGPRGRFSERRGGEDKARVKGHKYENSTHPKTPLGRAVWTGACCPYHSCSFCTFIHIFFFLSFYTGSLMKGSQVHGRYLDM